MRLTLLGLALALAAWPVAAVPSTAQDVTADPEWTACADETGSDPAGMIAACTRLPARDSLEDIERSQAHFYRGRAHIDRQEWREGIADYDVVLRLTPDDVNAWHNRGAAFAGLEQYDRAFADYSRGLELDPNDAASGSPAAWPGSTRTTWPARSAISTAPSRSTTRSPTPSTGAATRSTARSASPTRCPTSTALLR
jgi:tetratricopeptide (TPR) repeat protein